MTNRQGKPPYESVVLTPEQVESKLAELRAEREAWARLYAKWGHFGALEDEIGNYEWLRGPAQNTPSAPSADA
ncbi:MAG: hypothetical protein NVS3B1_29530 [Marmoricola sp.]